jgi:SAM-dependent methyltransferase
MEDAIHEYNEEKRPSGPEIACPSCRSGDTKIFHIVGSVPVNSVLNIRSRKEAVSFPRGEIILRICHQCGFIYNEAFDPRKIHYSSDCEESQGYSPTFNSFLLDLATKLFKKYNLREKRIIEIGCGKGEFLSLLCKLGNNHGIGFDPAFVPGRGQFEHVPNVKFVKDYYSEKYAFYSGDMICCRMTLEHIPNTLEFVQTVRKSIGQRDDTIVFFQVPDVIRILRDCAFEDIYYEHCSYFSPGSLIGLFRKGGFDILDFNTDYDGQYIMLEAKPLQGKVESWSGNDIDLKELKKYTLDFGQRHFSKTKEWDYNIKKFISNGEKVVLWGSGSKAVSFLTTLGIIDEISYVVDINPFKQGNFMAGTGQKIIAPKFLIDFEPDIVIIMNPIYRKEIGKDLEEMGLEPVIFTL